MNALTETMRALVLAMSISGNEVLFRVGNTIVSQVRKSGSRFRRSRKRSPSGAEGEDGRSKKKPVSTGGAAPANTTGGSGAAPANTAGGSGATPQAGSSAEQPSNTGGAVPKAKPKSGKPPSAIPRTRAEKREADKKDLLGVNTQKLRDERFDNSMAGNDARKQNNLRKIQREDWVRQDC